jgi:hypothetical protein
MSMREDNERGHIRIAVGVAGCLLMFRRCVIGCVVFRTVHASWNGNKLDFGATGC